LADVFAMLITPPSGLIGPRSRREQGLLFVGQSRRDEQHSDFALRLVLYRYDNVCQQQKFGSSGLPNTHLIQKNV
jgi:hypothetical protein